MKNVIELDTIEEVIDFLRAKIRKQRDPGWKSNTSTLPLSKPLMA
jgi:hypothetical protein